jgi:septal ring factor EnvC (AmiA/AmiB activator)
MQHASVAGLSMRLNRGWLPALMLCLMLGVTQCWAQKTQQKKTAAERDQAELRDRLRQLKSELTRNEVSRVEARDALQKSEAAISQTNRRLRELGNEQHNVKNRIEELSLERRQIEQQQQAERQRLAQLVRAQYMGDRASQWQLFLQGENPNRTVRNLAYLDYFARAQADSIARLETLAQHLMKLSAAEKHRQVQLSALETEKLKARQQLETEKSERSATLQKIARQVEQQRRQVGALERDTARLNDLIARLDKLLEQERKKQQRQQQARRAAPSASTTARTDQNRQSKDSGRGLPPPENSTGFSATRGKLPLPVQGTLAGRFGQVRESGQTTWKGIYLRKAEGTEVQAIAAGRVVFSDWLRGFGNLMIIDHGDQYLSIYAGNEALYKQAGQEVKGGEAIASIGNTLGVGEPGLYFEMRYRGTPFDPLVWVK